MSEHTYKYDVIMSCDGCSNAVNRVLQKLDGVKDINVSLKDQTATVISVDDNPDFDTVLAKISNTGKKVKNGTRDGVVMPPFEATAA